MCNTFRAIAPPTKCPPAGKPCYFCKKKEGFPRGGLFAYLAKIGGVFGGRAFRLPCKKGKGFRREGFLPILQKWEGFSQGGLFAFLAKMGRIS